MKKTTGLILVSHGSLQSGAANTLLEHAERIRGSGEYSCVEVAFLNYSEPRLDAAVRSCSAQGLERIVIVPYFLVAGKFVKKDLLQAVSGVKSLVPSIQIDIAEPIGYDVALAQAILDLARNATSKSRRISTVRNSALLVIANG